MTKPPQPISRIVVLCIGLLIFLSAPQVSAHATAAPDLTDSVWKWNGEDTSFVLTFVQGKPQPNGVAAILKGWGQEPLELRGEFSESDSEPRLHLGGSYEGETVALDLGFNPGDHEQQPYLYGEFSIGSKVFPVSAGCDRQCPDVASKKGVEPDAGSSAATTAGELIGEWQDESEAIGFKEYWAVTSVGGKWEVSGRFIKGKEVVGTFHAEEASFDAKKGVLYFRQVFDQKPDERWVDSNDIEVSAQSDTLKFKVRGVEATLTRTPGSRK
jgi:hypothetical protein